MMFRRRATEIPTPEAALPGRSTPLATGDEHFVLSRPLKGPFPSGLETIYFGLGCFWGAERLFWQLGSGIWTTAVGYAGGSTPNATYEEVCSGRTGHSEVVMVVFDPSKIPVEALLETFWESHDPTQGFRQGNDVGTQYRSVIYTTTDAQAKIVEASRGAYDAALAAKGFGHITTEIRAAPEFFYAEEYHQQYLAKVPSGYCGLRGTGVACPTPAPTS